MATYPAFIVDAFAETPFKGNQAAVCLIDQLSDEQYPKIAAEFNFSETAYPMPLDVPRDFKKASRFSLRWFTPTIEVTLCGHATLATAHVLFNEIGNTNDEIYFETLSGELIVQKSKTQDGAVSMNFPQFTEMYDIELSNQQSFGAKFPAIENPRHFVELANEIGPCKKLTYSPTLQELIMVLDSKMTKKDFIEINPSIDKLLKIQPLDGNRSAIILTLSPENPTKQGFVDSHGKPYDYASRYFTPWAGIDEDPATGKSWL
uniref:Uncharacterized protein n=1 Tax=Acrobeloides nanus TaxID=290746 RepID=A0A914E1U5_9BILA